MVHLLGECFKLLWSILYSGNWENFRFSRVVQEILLRKISKNTKVLHILMTYLWFATSPLNSCFVFVHSPTSCLFCLKLACPFNTNGSSVTHYVTAFQLRSLSNPFETENWKFIIGCNSKSKWFLISLIMISYWKQHQSMDSGGGSLVHDKQDIAASYLAQLW